MCRDNCVQVNSLEHSRSKFFVHIFPVRRHIDREPCLMKISTSHPSRLYLRQKARDDTLHSPGRRHGKRRFEWRTESCPIEVRVFWRVQGWPKAGAASCCWCVTICCTVCVSLVKASSRSGAAGRRGGGRRLGEASRCSSSVALDGSRSEADELGVMWTGVGSGGPIPDGPGCSASRFEVDVPERSSGIPNNCCRKCLIFLVEAGDAEGYALCRSPEMTSDVCGPGVPGGERARLGRRKEHIHLAH